MATIQELRAAANQVRYEIEQGANTAERIGRLYNGIIDFLAVIDGEGGAGYDDSALRDAIERINSIIAELDKSIENLNNLADQERDRLDEVVENLDKEINDKVEKIFDDADQLSDHADTIRDLVNEGEVYWQSGWNEKIEAYLQEVGVWARNGDIIKTQWSQITQSVDQIKSQVADVEQDLDGKVTTAQWSEIVQKANTIEQNVNKLINQGDISEALQASIKQSIDDKVASLELETTYAKIDTEDAKKVLEWMYSGLKNQSSRDLTFNELVSAGKSGMNNAISSIRTQVEKLENGDYVATGSFESKVDDVITGLYNEAYKDKASTAIFSKLKKNSEDIASIVTSITGDASEVDIATKMGKFKSGLVTFAGTKDKDGTPLEAALASLVTENEETGGVSGLALVSYVNEQVAELTTAIGKSAATLVLKSTFNEAMADLTTKVDENYTSLKEEVTANGNAILTLEAGTKDALSKLQVRSDGIEARVGTNEKNMETIQNNIDGYMDDEGEYHKGLLERLGIVDERSGETAAWVQANQNSIIATINRFDSDGKLINTSGLVTTDNWSGLIAEYYDKNNMVTKSDLSLQLRNYITAEGVEGMMSVAHIKADKIDFEGVQFGWTVRNTNNDIIFNLDSSGNLSIAGEFSGQFNGGKITDKVTVGSSGGVVEIYVDEQVSQYVNIKQSGIRGVSGGTRYFTLGFQNGASLLYPWLSMRAPDYAGNPGVQLEPVGLKFYVGNTRGLIVGINGNKVEIQAPTNWWPSSSEASTGQVYLDNGTLKVKT